MINIHNRVLIYGLAAFCLIIIGFGVFANKTNAQYYYSTSPTNTTSDYAHYRQICPADFTLTVYNSNQYMCYKLFGGSVLGASYPYNPVLPVPNLIPGCLPGYTFSQFTGQSCNGNYHNNGNLNGGYGDISNFEARNGDDDNPQEGDNDAEIIEVRFDVEDGDIELDKIEFNFEFTGDNSGEDMPWNIFDEVKLLSDGREIAQMNTDDEDDWDEENNDTYSLVFKNLNEIIRENDEARLTLEVDLNSHIYGSNSNDVSWEIYVPDDGLRARNGNGNTVYAGDDSESVSIDINEN